MVLPSQSTRTMNLRSDMYRKRRSKRGPVMIVVALTGGLILFAGYKLWFDEPRRAVADTLPDAPAVPVSAPTSKPSSAVPAAQQHTPARSLEIDPKSVKRVEEPRVVMGGNPTQSPPPVQPPLGRDTAIVKTNPPPPPPAAPPTIHKESPAAQPGAGAGAAPRTPETAAAMSLMQRGMDELTANRLVNARVTFTQALTTGALPVVEAERARTTLSEINERLVFSPEITPGDPFATAYAVESGDSLEKIVRNEKPLVDWRFIQRINGISRPESIRVGQKLKLVKGPFHAEVHKQTFRMDLFLGEGPQRVLVASLPVGLGEHKSTPIGLFKVRPQSKLVDPSWANPRTGESFSSADPKNPIGEYWIGLQGLDEATSGLAGYGIHGTIEPDSIGREKSMGCVRMLADDIKLVYEMLVEDKSTVRIVND